MVIEKPSKMAEKIPVWSVFPQISLWMVGMSGLMPRDHILGVPKYTPTHTASFQLLWGMGEGCSPHALLMASQRYRAGHNEKQGVGEEWALV